MEIAYFVVAFIVLGAAIFSYRVWEQNESVRRLMSWAEGNQYTIIDAVSRRWAERPGFFSSSMLQMVFHVKIKEPGGREREGWVRMGGFFSGLTSRNVDVFWEPTV